MLIPDRDGHYWCEGQRCIDYHAMVDGFHRIIEVYTLEDGTKWCEENYWDKMNDIEKYVCRQRGWDLEKYYKS